MSRGKRACRTCRTRTLRGNCFRGILGLSLSVSVVELVKEPSVRPAKQLIFYEAAETAGVRLRVMTHVSLHDRHVTFDFVSRMCHGRDFELANCCPSCLFRKIFNPNMRTGSIESTTASVSSSSYSNRMFSPRR